MIEKVFLWDHEIELDKTATKTWYDNAGEWRCDCAACRNFTASAKQDLLPFITISTLSMLGISPEKATWVCHIASNAEGHLYRFSYRIAGRILSKPDGHDVIQTDGTGHFRSKIYTHGAPDFPEPHFDLEFCAYLPWLLNESFYEHE